MKTNRVRLSGVASACLFLLLAGCVSKPIVRTETVTVETPVVVALDARLTRPVPTALVPTPLTNDGLIGYGESNKCRLITANCQLEKIEALQPGVPRWPATWCLRLDDACKAGGK